MGFAREIGRQSAANYARKVQHQQQSRKMISDMYTMRRRICTCCNSGYRGNIAADELNKQGFHPVTIEGRYSAYKDERIKKKKESSNSNERILE